MENFEEFSDQLVAKRKRTKRPRHSSSASSSGAAFDFSSYNSFLSVSSPTTSTTTEEEEDMANCLILLARGGHDKQSENNNKFPEITTSAAAKVGIYVYECKTCSRSFSSFQALGGHRASHKRPKMSTSAADQIDQKKSSPPRSDDDESREEGRKTVTKPSGSVSPKLVNITKPKIHECAICGSEFASGQALGGHMRRHRPATAGRNANGSPSEDAGDNSRHVFQLDLNLPAPPEDFVFSAVSLVDCHY